MAAKIKESQKQYLWFAGVVLSAGLLYLKTISPAVDYIDSGELAVNCFLLGIPHPTGYPLYVLLGKLAVLMLPGEVIFRCHLLSLISTAFSTGLIFLILRYLFSKEKYKNPAAASIALFIGFSPVWWSQGISNEVYCLTLLADLTAILLFIRYSFERNPKFLIAGFYVWGLSFGAHMSSIFLLPAVLYILLSTDGIKSIFRKSYLLALIFFILALSIYIYLPVRAAFKPFLNWSDPSNPESFLNHISGWQYRVWMFKSPAQMVEGIKYFFYLLYEQFGVAGLILAVLGFIRLVKVKIKTAIFILIIIVADIIYSSNYEIIDIDSYYLLGFAGTTLFAGFGLIVIAKMFYNIKLLRHSKFVINTAIIIILTALPLSNILGNYNKQDKSNRVSAVKGAETLLASIDKNGLAIIENWDLYSPWLYYRYVLNERPDVVIIDKELLRRSWYLDFLRRNYPNVMFESERQIDRFLRLLKPFETGEEFNPQALNTSFQAMISSIIEYNSEKRPVYTNILQDEDITTSLARTPAGVLYKFEEKFGYIEFDINRIDISGWETPDVIIDRRTKLILTGFHRAIRFREGLCRQLGYNDEADQYFNLGKRIEKIITESTG